LLITHGLAALERAEELAKERNSTGSYAIQAKIAACHGLAPPVDVAAQRAVGDAEPGGQLASRPGSPGLQQRQQPQ
jgi:hypothetical protein